MSFLSRFSVNNPVAICIVIILIVVAGIYSVPRYKQESLPYVEIPYLHVTTVYGGASSQEVQNEITVPINRALKNVEGIKVSQSTSAANFSDITMEFGFKEDMNEKLKQVEEVLRSVTLPAGADKPQTSKFTIDDKPIMYLSLSKQNDIQDSEFQQVIADELMPKLENVSGISQLKVYGLASKNVYVKLDPIKLEANKIAPQQVIQLLRATNTTIPFGTIMLNNSSTEIQISGNFDTIEELKKFALEPSGQLRLSDVAVISEGFAQQDTITRQGGATGSLIHIMKDANANVVEISDQIQKISDEFDSGKVKMEIIYDSATDVRKSVGGLTREAILAAIFASLFIFIFLRNARATLIAIVSIPLSILITLAFLKYFTDITMNVLTLGGITVAIGRVVDDSIVVIENIIRRSRNEKITKDLVVEATKEVGKAVTASTVTTVAVFLPLSVVSGYIGKIFAPFSLSVIVALVASLIVSLTVVPMLSFVLLRNAKVEQHKEEGLLIRSYVRCLKWFITHKKTVLIGALVFILLSIPLVKLTEITFFPQKSGKYIKLIYNLPKGVSLPEVDSKAREIDTLINQSSDVKKAVVTSGSLPGELDPNTYLASTGNKAEWFIALQNDTDIQSFIANTKDQLKEYVSGNNLEIREIIDGPQGPDISIVINGSDLKDIKSSTEQVIAALEGIEGTANIAGSISDYTKAVDINIRAEDALKYGLTTGQAWELINPIFSQNTVGKLGNQENASDIVVQYDKKNYSINELRNLPILSPTGQWITAKEIADIKEVEHLGLIQYQNDEQFSVITGQIIAENSSEINSKIKEKLSLIQFPDNVDLVQGGSSKQVEEMITDMVLAIIIAVGLVYMAMVVTFGGGKIPFTILFSFPLAFTGAILGTVLAGQPISIASLIGLLMLIGIVVTNAIVLVDRVQQERASGLTIREALIHSSKVRVRPIIITTVTTIAALLPLVIGVGEGGSLVSKGLAVVVIGGLITSTILTLFIIPTLYEVFHYRKLRSETK
ncbi:efflux RND transporter permease subunit [Paenibacillus amylolyticus]|uniref:Efflux RND transporter permease subunit n=1 Tax=Paenibacillus amylolyticus TaxID=1451 RepID=A0A5M9WVV6_PAEAM|nr:efflux RND transporter permease subunit [Paenibacillus amylolyticus]KAA8785741.1 efflux RND transporter permease subunit [Paenibacillus amylolyticus]